SHEAWARCRASEPPPLGRPPEGQLLLNQHDMRPILVRRNDAVVGEPEPAAQIGSEPGRILDRGRALGPFLADQVWIAPKRLAIRPPVDREGPARRLFARIPFALAVVQQAAPGQPLTQPPPQLVGVASFPGPQTADVPFPCQPLLAPYDRRL